MIESACLCGYLCAGGYSIAFNLDGVWEIYRGERWIGWAGSRKSAWSVALLSESYYEAGWR